MTFLPIVERELRVAARRKFTYWFRPTAAGIMLLVFGIFLAIWTYGEISGVGIPIGVIEFQILRWMAFIVASSSGLFLTADSLSEEKREGTLGLLFLTDLRGHDVVLGKLLSSSLQAVFGLLAAFPIMALPLMMGGVSGQLFWRSLLAICNTLFFSLAVGMMVSSFSREVMKAMSGTVLILLLFLIGLPWFDLGLAGWNEMRFECHASIASPGYLFSHLENQHATDFWEQTGLQNLAGWIFLAVACVCVPRTWQERANLSVRKRVSLGQRWRLGGSRFRQNFRRRLLQVNPCLWLAARDRWLPRLLWTVVTLGVAFEIWHWWYWRYTSTVMVTELSGLLTLLIFIWAAAQASRFFVDAVRNGAMELMLVTPIDHRQIVRGQWSALWRTFLFPICMISIASIVRGFQTLSEWAHNAGVAKPPFQNTLYVQQFISMSGSVLDLFVGLSAVAWFGMLMGVQSRKTSVAVLKTLLFVVVIPWLATMILRIVFMLILVRPFQGHNLYWFSEVIVVVVSLFKDLTFIFVSRWYLNERLRDAVTATERRPAIRHLPPPPIPLSRPNSEVIGV